MKHLLLLTLLIAPLLAASAADKKPNIVLVMCDDLGWGDVGFNGNTTIKTPHLDQMAKDGLTLKRFYAAAPVCSPTRGSVVTGRHPFRYGIYHANTGHMKAQELTLAELLKTKGYRTGHFGKWHLGTLTKTVKDANRGGPKGAKHYSPPQDNGFDVCFSTESKVPTWDPMLVPKKFGNGENRKNWWTPVEAESDAAAYGTYYWNEKGEQVRNNLRGANPRVILDRAAPFIEDAAKADDPFFAIVWFHTPHLPVIAGPKHTALYPDHSGHAQHYYGCISAMDEQLGRLRKTLRDAGVADNTILCFCSDNGPEGNDKSPGRTGGFRGRKRSLYEGGVRVPAIIEWPGVTKAASKTDFHASTADYLPTILAAVGAELPDERPIDGIDLKPALSGAKEERDSAIGFQSTGISTWVGPRYKLYRPKKGPAELYDLIDDPFEKTDIAATKPDVVSAMGKELDTWIASCKTSDEEKDYAAAAPLFRFGAIADCQFANVPPAGSRHYKLAKEKLTEAVAELNTNDLAFSIHLGDFIDRDWSSFDEVAPIYSGLKAPGYHLLGNHDFSVKDSEKTAVAERLGMPARYYDFTSHGWRFIVLDGNALSTYAHAKGSAEAKTSLDYLAKLSPKPPRYCGAMDQAQIAWLTAKLVAAKKAGEKVILFNHFPILPAPNNHNLWNDTELIDTLKPYAGTVVAWINGHNHAGAYAEQNGIHFLTLHGMLDTKSNAYAVIEVHENALFVDGRGRQPDLTLKF